MTERTACCDHASDCAVHNAPAYPAGLCDCGAAIPDLVGALAPFSCSFHDIHEDDVVVATIAGKPITTGDCRKARAAISKAKGYAP